MRERDGAVSGSGGLEWLDPKGSPDEVAGVEVEGVGRGRALF